MKSLGIRYYEKKRLKIEHQIAGIDTYEIEVALKVKTHPTKHAPDAGDSAAFTRIFLALGFSTSQALSYPARVRR